MDVDGSSASVVRERESDALKAMRSLADAVDGDVEVSVELELLAEKLGAMGGAGCSVELWRKVRSVAVIAHRDGSGGSEDRADVDAEAWFWLIWSGFGADKPRRSIGWARSPLAGAWQRSS